jgi:hypothetical protein
MRTSCWNWPTVVMEPSMAGIATSTPISLAAVCVKGRHAGRLGGPPDAQQGAPGGL